MVINIGIGMRWIAAHKLLCIMILIRFLYSLLCRLELTDLWYQGTGNYGISYVFYKDVLSWLVFWGISYVFAGFKYNGNLIKTVILLLYILYYIPLNSSYALNDMPFLYFVLTNFYFFFLVLITYKIDSKYIVKDRTFNTDILVVRILFSAICIIYIFHKLSYNGLSFSFSLSGDVVYSNRDAYQIYLDSISGTPFSYLLSIIRNLTSYVAPFYLFFSILNKRIGGMIISTLTIFSLFSVEFGKTTIIFIAVIIFILLIYKLKLLNYIYKFFLIGITSLLIICFVEYFFIGDGPIFMLLVRRVMYIPSWLNTMYYNFFESNPILLFSDSVFLLQTIIPNKYEYNIITLINNAYFNGTMPSPNTGLFAEAFMQLGVIGVLIFPIIIACFLFVSDKIFYKYGRITQILIAIRLALQLINVPILRTDFVLSFWLFTFIVWFGSIYKNNKLEMKLGRYTKWL